MYIYIINYRYIINYVIFIFPIVIPHSFYSYNYSIFWSWGSGKDDNNNLWSVLLFRFFSTLGSCFHWLNHMFSRSPGVTPHAELRERELNPTTTATRPRYTERTECWRLDGAKPQMTGFILSPYSLVTHRIHVCYNGNIVYIYILFYPHYINRWLMI